MVLRLSLPNCEFQGHRYRGQFDAEAKTSGGIVGLLFQPHSRARLHGDIGARPRGLDFVSVKLDLVGLGPNLVGHIGVIVGLIRAKLCRTWYTSGSNRVEPGILQSRI